MTDLPETPELERRVAILQKDVEEIKEELEDSWHDRTEQYKGRVRSALENDLNASQLFLEIDGMRSINEIENALASAGKRIPHATLWRASQDLIAKGLIKKVAVKERSPIYNKKPWAGALGIDDYVRKEILKENTVP